LSAKEKKAKKEEKASGPGWLCTFNDLMTLLMVFFVMIFSMSTIDLDKSSGIIGSLQSGLGVLEAGSSVDIAVVDPQPSVQSLENEMGNISEVYNAILSDMSETEKEPVHDDEIGKTKNYITQKNMDKIDKIPGISTKLTHEGVLITMQDQLLFDAGKSNIHPNAFPILNQIIESIKMTNHQIRIEGHTDNLPINTQKYPSNWELSIDRAIHVLKYFSQQGHISPNRLSAVGYADVKPVAENNTLENRIKNRRVEILLYKGGNQKNEQ
jgi:chemotaxis protein MotB